MKSSSFSNITYELSFSKVIFAYLTLESGHMGKLSD